MAKPPKSANSLRQDDLVGHLKGEGDAPPDTVVLTGFLAQQPEQGMWRIYLTPALDSYFEVREEDVVRQQQLSGESFPLGGSVLWVRSKANLRFGRLATVDVQAEFLQGDVINQLAGSTGAPNLATEPRTLTLMTCNAYCGARTLTLLTCNDYCITSRTLTLLTCNAYCGARTLTLLTCNDYC